MALETPYLKDCKRLSKITGFSIEELFDEVVGLVIDKKHEYYGEIGLLDRTIYGNVASDLGYRIIFSDGRKFDFYNEYKKDMPEQLCISKNLEEILNLKEKMKFPGKIN
ncbi:MAG: hypothetical protein AABW67_01130 [Nanoarchaeota archaeon]